MLFNSPVFIFAFAPVALGVFWLLRTFGSSRLALGSTLLASLLFYGWDDAWRLPPLVMSTLFNFFVGRRLVCAPDRRLLAFGIASNLALLGYFKYANFLIYNLNLITGLSLPTVHASLPPGISFYTLTQIMFLVDASRSLARRYPLLEYSTFVAFYPHLVAGPILNHGAVLPQMLHLNGRQRGSEQIAHGLAWFAAGLFKKTVFADNLAHLVSGPFAAAAAGQTVGFADAWTGALAYALQLYFDFSGYSDMAIGLALMMGISFPINFNSPYQAATLAEFWRRWHMTLSHFLRDYLYIPLGGSRKGPMRTAIAIMSTMLIGGLWHGASWNFVLWGGLHGAGLVVSRFAGSLARRYDLMIGRAISWPLTLLFVVAAWVAFRSENLMATFSLWSSMTGFNGFGGTKLSSSSEATVAIALLGAIVLLCPNTQSLIGAVPPSRLANLGWRPSFAWAIVTGAVLGIAVAAGLSLPTEFLYFQF